MSLGIADIAFAAASHLLLYTFHILVKFRIYSNYAAAGIGNKPIVAGPCDAPILA